MIHPETTKPLLVYLEAGEIEIRTGPFGTQLKASEYVNEGTPVINVRNIGFGSLRPEKLEYLPEEVATRLHQHRLRAGDIVFGRKGAVERHLLVKENQADWIQGSDCIRVRIISGSLNPHFLSYCLLLEEHQHWIQSQASHGATMATLNQGIIERIRIPDRTTSEQQRVVAVLSTYDDLIEVNQRRIAILEDMARRLFDEWFVRFRYPGHEAVPLVDTELGMVPEGWTPRTLSWWTGEVRDTISPQQVEPLVAYVGLEHLPRRSTTLLEVGKAQDVTSSKLKFEAGDILFGKIRPYFHKVALMPFSGVCSTDAICIRPTNPKHTALILGLASSDAFVAHAVATSNGTKMPRADWKVLKNYPLPEAPEHLLETFERTVHPMVNSAANLAAQNNRLRAARDLLLPKLISGEVDVSAAEQAFAVAAE